MRAAGKTLTGQELFDEIEDAGPDVRLYISIGGYGEPIPVDAVETIGDREAHLTIEDEAGRKMDALASFVERVQLGDWTKKQITADAEELMEQLGL